ncbi:hypothetical protein KC19_2G029400 [Ceratodon purpureus]|uniref:Uncharacterized protein n=1 Tax=Ceratodon purpureus TaxID=3225 RepID=A0A8T0IPJ8_CERPU|nr:hypothetical protein KC19_2G029400 [Ceratodon purpureus]
MLNPASSPFSPHTENPLQIIHQKTSSTELSQHNYQKHCKIEPRLRQKPPKTGQNLPKKLQKIAKKCKRITSVEVLEFS